VFYHNPGFFLVDYGFLISDFVYGDADSDCYVWGNEVAFMMSYLKINITAPCFFLAGDIDKYCQAFGGDVAYFLTCFQDFGSFPIMGDYTDLTNKPLFSAEKIIDG
jgi:hypothetical protein